MYTRTVFGLAVLCIVSFACSGDGPTPPPPPPPLVTTISISTPASGLTVDTVVVAINASNATSCTPIIISGATLLDANACTGFRIILGSQPGTAIVSASATGVSGVVNAEQKQISILARPVVFTKDTLSVSLFSAEESDSLPQGMRMRAIWIKSGIKDSLDVLMTDGNVSVEIPISLDSIKMRFEGDPRYWPDSAIARRGDYYHKAVEVIIKPRTWKIRSLQFLGQLVPVSPTLARKPSGPNDPLSYWLFSHVNKSTGGEELKLQGVSTDQFPRPVGIFIKSQGALPEDSIFIADKVLPVINKAMGKTVFISGKRIETDTIPNGMVAVRILNSSNELLGPALGDGIVNQQGEIFKSYLDLSSRYYLNQGQVGVLVHELMHNLGVGHTCAWVSRMNSSFSIYGNPECYGMGTTELTPTDIAVFEMGTAIRELAKKKNTPFAFN